MTRPPYPPPSEAELAAVRAQLGRPPRGVLGIAARLPDGTPAVVATEPRLPDGTPFPTFYYLTDPGLTAAMSRLEAAGAMAEYSALLAADAELATRYAAAHEQYLADRAPYGEPPELDRVSAGGMPERVKCLHALAAHALAAGSGVNPIGDRALADAGLAELLGPPAAPSSEPPAASPAESHPRPAE